MSNDRRIVASSIVDNDAGFSDVLYGAPHDIGCFPHHLRLEQAFHELVEWVALA